MQTAPPCAVLTCAGSNAYTFSLLAEQSPEDLVSVVETNVLGVMLCCREVRPAPVLGAGTAPVARRALSAAPDLEAVIRTPPIFMFLASARPYLRQSA